MSISDPLGDMLTRIRNAQLRRRGTVLTPGSRLRARVLDVLKSEGYIRDYSQCVMCWRCIQVCADDVQFTYALTWGGRGMSSHVATFFDEDMPDTSCVFCGNCVGAPAS